MKQFRTLFLGISLAVFFGCADTSFEGLPDEQGEENQGGQDNQTEGRTIFAIDFENDAAGFVVNQFGDHVEGSPVIHINEEQESKCGTLFIGKSEDFTEWNGYDFQGNDTQFMGLDMGACGGFFEAVVETEFVLEESLSVERAKLEFKYYMPGNFTGWGDPYLFNVIIEREETDNNGSQGSDYGNFANAFIQFEVEENQDGWVNFSRVLPVDVPAGKYKLIVEIIGSSAAIDDIKLTDLSASQDGDQGGNDNDNGGQDGDQDGNDNDNDNDGDNDNGNQEDN